MSSVRKKIGVSNPMSYERCLSSTDRPILLSYVPILTGVYFIVKPEFDKLAPEGHRIQNLLKTVFSSDIVSRRQRCKPTHSSGHFKIKKHENRLYGPGFNRNKCQTKICSNNT